MSLTSRQHSELSNAIEFGDVVVVKSLLQRFPDIVNHPNWTPPPLHCAILWNQPDIVELLLDHGADIELRDPDRQTTPLRYAIMFCKTKLIPILLARGANAGPIEENGTSAMGLALEVADGKYDGFDDLPDRQAYNQVIEVLERSGFSG